MSQLRRLALVIALAITPALAGEPPKNIILLVGDGMGPAHVTAARQLRGADFNIGRMKTVGLFTTMCADRFVTDSGAAASAFATGEKTKYEALSVDAAGAPRRTVLEAARAAGKSTGLVTTAQFYDATPAAFASHVDERHKSLEVTSQMLHNAVDVIAGTGSEIFGKPPLPPLGELATSNGYTLVTDPAALDTAPRSKVLAAFPSQTNDLDTPGAELPRLARWALDRLSPNPKGFFLLLEEEGIDSSSHVNNTTDLNKALRSFDTTVGIALDFAARNGNTLVIVLGDHETGALRIDESRAGRFREEWASIEHTAVAIPIFTQGPGSERFTGFFDNTDIGKTLLEFEGDSRSRYFTSDVANILRALGDLGGGPTTSFVAGKDLDPEARRAFALGRTINDLTDANRSLPAGTIRIDRFDIRGNKASVRIWRGPLPAPAPGVALLDCGKGMTYELERQSDGIWRVVSTGITVC